MNNRNENMEMQIEESLKNILTRVARSEQFNNYKILLNYNRTKGEGFLSEFYTGTVLNEDNGKELQVAIKKAPTGGFSGVFGNVEIYGNEIFFYSEMFSTLDKFQREKKVNYPFQHIPRYLTGSVESSNIFVAMENLKTQGYVLFEKNQYFDSEHLEFLFKIYGKFHALSFSFKQRNEKEFENLVNTFHNLFKKFTESEDMTQITSRAYLSALKAFDPVTEADILTKLKTVENVSETMKKLKDYKGLYKCLIHGDCWSNNMLFKYKETGELEDIKLLDFQVAYLGNPIYDLSYFFYSGASKQDMDKLDYYLDVYYESFSNFTRELGEKPEEIFPLEVLKKEWKQYGLWGIFLACQVWVVKLQDQNEINNSMADQNEKTTEEYFNTLEEKWSIVLKGAEYQERTRNICIHAVENGIIGS